MTKDNSLILVHVLFRHGERTPDADYMYPSYVGKKESFEPYGSGCLTNEGKKSMYDLGKTIRKKYDEFLGSYRHHLCDFWSSGYDRAKTSLNAFLAGLYPPRDELIWCKDLLWDPLPSHHIRKEDDELFLSMVSSTKFLNMYRDNFNNSEEGRAISEKYKDLFDYIAKNTGYDQMSTREIYFVRDVLTTRLEYGLELPDWVKPDVFKAIQEIALYENSMQMATADQRKLLSGKLCNKILEDTKEKIDGVSKKMIHVYSGHDINIAHTLTIFDVMFPHVPVYNSCIVIEVHNVDGEHAFKVLYKQNKTSDFETMIFPNGQDFCSVKDFERIVTKLLSASVQFTNDLERVGKPRINVS